ncbi:MAG TPA: tetratricopeptide repeat protein, partial [Burkholderiaceae bacterium]|nr:tetratricopeptide repeat protein [Burkholderiaceae bacterium]
AAPVNAASADALAQAEARISGMVDRLAERLKNRPDDAEGWQMLGRSYATLGRHEHAIAAYETALKLRPDEPTLLAELAFSAAITNRRVGGADSTQLLQRALKLDPRNPKALALAGTLSLERKDYRGAVQYWEQLARNEPADSPLGKQIQASIAQARQLAGSQSALMPVAADDALASITASATPARAAAPGTVSGTVTLAPALAGRVAPDDTVFVFARAIGGSRMPLAVLRKQVKDLPLRFTLDDSLAMSPAAKLSGAANVVVGARVSKSGKAGVQEGDLQGQLPAVALGTANLKLEIGDVVKSR